MDLVEQEAAFLGTFEAATTSSRTGFLRGAAAGGGVVAGGVVAGGALALPELVAAAGSKSNDTAVLNFILQLEYLQAEFYREAEASKLGGALGQFAQVVGGHERAHVAFIQKALGRKAAKRPRFDFGEAAKNAKAFSAAAVVLENIGLAAYNGQAPSLSKGTLAAAAKIASVEARHASWIRAIRGENPAPDASDSGQTAAQVTAALKRAGFVKSA